MHSYRIGNRTRPRQPTGNTPESQVLRSLFELRKRMSDDSHNTMNVQNDTEITFWNCCWSRRIFQSLNKLIVRDGQRFSTMKFFDCEVNTKDFAEIIALVLSNNATVSLVIKNTNLPGSRRTFSDPNEPSSRPCTLTMRSMPTDILVLKALDEGLSKNTTLKSLQLSGLNFACSTVCCNTGNEENYSEGACRWCETLLQKTTLRHLDLSSSRFSTETVAMLSDSLSSNLQLESLDISRCNLDDFSLSRLIRSITQHPKLKKLNLSSNFIGAGNSTLALDAIGDLLRSETTQVEHLNLSLQKLQSKTLSITSVECEENEERCKRSFQNALVALSQNKCLRSIDLSGNEHCFADLRNIETLTSCLVTNTGLRHVDISSCHISSPGIEYLAHHCIPHCRDNLKALILFHEDDSHCQWKEGEWISVEASLFEAMQSNTGLETLGNIRDDIDAVYFQKSNGRIQQILNLNRAGRRAFVTEDLPLALWPRLLERAGRVKYDLCLSTIDDTSNQAPSVFFSLLRGPALLESR